MSILKLEKVNYKYKTGTKNVLQDVDLSFETGKIYAIIGKSGSGKTTLLSLISGLDVATDGTIYFQDKDLKSIDRDLYRAQDIGVIFQQYNLIQNASAIDNLVLSMDISASKVENKKQHAIDLLTQVGIERQDMDRNISKLSGGQQQRVGIARALSSDASVIIADEPTGNLDGETEGQILDIFKTLAYEQNKCVIIVTHTPTVAAIADKKYGLANGKVLNV